MKGNETPADIKRLRQQLCQGTHCANETDCQKCSCLCAPGRAILAALGMEWQGEQTTPVIARMMRTERVTAARGIRGRANSRREE